MGMHQQRSRHVHGTARTLQNGGRVRRAEGTTRGNVEHPRRGSFVPDLLTLALEAATPIELLDGLAVAAAQVAGNQTGTALDCAICLRLPKKPALYGGSSTHARRFGRAEQALGSGPCTDPAPPGGLAVDADLRGVWPELHGYFGAAGYRSIVRAAVDLPQEATGTFAFLCRDPQGALTSVEAVRAVVGECAVVLKVAAKTFALKRHIEDLTAAMETRSAIDTACGVLMAQSKCSPEEAFDMLRRASNNRNEKVHTLAMEILQGISHRPEPHSFSP